MKICLHVPCSYCSCLEFCSGSCIERLIGGFTAQTQHARSLCSSCRRFCEVPWGHAKRQFASDRRHMRKAPPTTAQAEPPSSQHEGIGNHTSGAQSFGSRANDAESASPLSREDGSETGETLTSHTAHAVLNSRTQCGSNCGACGNSGVAASESGTGDMCSPHQARGNLAGDVEWQSPPPPWPCIQSPGAPFVAPLAGGYVYVYIMFISVLVTGMARMHLHLYMAFLH